MDDATEQHNVDLSAQLSTPVMNYSTYDNPFSSQGESTSQQDEIQGNDKILFHNFTPAGQPIGQVCDFPQVSDNATAYFPSTTQDSRPSTWQDIPWA
tara:strand:+ start:63 stop:353 length:291 start_codon:yes stop_codon:yes gene_type:complete